MILSEAVSLICVSIVFSLLYKLSIIMGFNFSKLLIIVVYGVLTFLMFIGYPIPQDSLFIMILLPFVYNFLDLLFFDKLEKYMKKIREENKPFNQPKYSSSGCLMGGTEGKNTNETIMRILQEGKEKAKEMNEKIKNKS